MSIGYPQKPKERVLHDASCKEDVVSLAKRRWCPAFSNLTPSCGVALFVWDRRADVRPAEEQVRALNYLLLLLPAENRQTLQQLMRLLASVAEHEASNRMSEQALATVLGPNLFPPRVLKGGARKNKLTDIQEGVMKSPNLSLQRSRAAEILALDLALT